MFPRYNAYIIAYITAALLILPWTIIQPRALNDLRNIAFDTYQRLNPRQFNVENPISIIGIDAESLKPFAKAPAVLGVALSKDGENNFKQKSGIVTLGDNPEQFLIKFPAFIGPITELLEPARGLGFTNWLPDHDQVVRNVPLMMSVNGSIITSLALEALRVAQNAQNYIIKSSNASLEMAFGQRTGINSIKVGNLEIPTGSSSEVRPYYSYSDERRYLSAKDVLENKIDTDIIKGRIFIIGAKATGSWGYEGNTTGSHNPRR